MGGGGWRSRSWRRWRGKGRIRRSLRRWISARWTNFMWAGLRVLDVGSGIGGPARYFAAEHGCRVTGIDLTEEFVRVARSLTARTKLDGLVEFRQGSALEMPFERESFDRAYMIHVGMNIADKAGIFREVRRVLKAGGLFTVFDIVRAKDGAMQYPVPWAASEE